MDINFYFDEEKDVVLQNGVSDHLLFRITENDFCVINHEILQLIRWITPPLEIEPNYLKQLPNSENWLEVLDTNDPNVAVSVMLSL